MIVKKMKQRQETNGEDVKNQMDCKGTTTNLRLYQTVYHL